MALQAGSTIHQNHGWTSISVPFFCSPISPYLQKSTILWLNSITDNFRGWYPKICQPPCEVSHRPCPNPWFQNLPMGGGLSPCIQPVEQCKNCPLSFSEIISHIFGSIEYRLLSPHMANLPAKELVWWIFLVFPLPFIYILRLETNTIEFETV